MLSVQYYIQLFTTESTSHLMHCVTLMNSMTFYFQIPPSWLQTTLVVFRFKCRTIRVSTQVSHYCTSNASLCCELTISLRSQET
ncbi:hypothetical protein Mapa_013149 [Marchantia paleacea]|nr:hypothetical protein Mapa_013149 [Marchantia paleacea]